MFDGEGSNNKQKNLSHFAYFRGTTLKSLVFRSKSETPNPSPETDGYGTSISTHAVCVGYVGLVEVVYWRDE